MQPYKSAGKQSGVTAYEIVSNGLIAVFQDGSTYLYNHAKPGRLHVAEMKKRALAGHDLTTYINQHVRGNYARKLK